MSMQCTSVGMLCSDVKAIHDFLAAQSLLVDVSAVQASHCRTICNRIHALDVLDITGGTQLTATFSSGPWTCSQKAEMASAIQSRLAVTIDGHASKVRRKNQTCTSFQNYLTERDVEMLKDSNVCSISACDHVLT